MNLFLEKNEERLKELAKRSGQAREKYLIGIINDLTRERAELSDYIKQVSGDLSRMVQHDFPSGPLADKG